MREINPKFFDRKPLPNFSIVGERLTELLRAAR
jgi:hypothetical protein